MKNAYIIRHHFSGPDNISIDQLTDTDLFEIYRALNIAEYSIPTEEAIQLKDKIKTFLNIHFNYTL
ncbi:MAG: hypothetical protein IJX39_06100 [Clostridia bacterium]|nr:hypothetical protein [Clostridia bacterium]